VSEAGDARVNEAGVTPDTPYRVLVVDDQAGFRRAAARIVAQMPGFSLVGEADTGEHGVTMARVLHPDVVLMDFRLPGMNGAQATRAIVAARPATVVVLVSATPTAELPPEARCCGATALAAKETLNANDLASLCRVNLRGEPRPS